MGGTGTLVQEAKRHLTKVYKNAITEKECDKKGRLKYVWKKIRYEEVLFQSGEFIMQKIILNRYPVRP